MYLFLHLLAAYDFSYIHFHELITLGYPFVLVIVKVFAVKLAGCEKNRNYSVLAKRFHAMFHQSRSSQHEFLGHQRPSQS